MFNEVRNRQKEEVIASQSQFLRYLIKELVSQEQEQLLAEVANPQELEKIILKSQIDTHPEETPATLEINGIRNFLKLAKHNQLSSKEKKIIQMLSWGWDLRAISLYLGLKTNTLYNMVSTILSKLQAKNRTQAIVIGLRGGFVS